MQSRAQSTEPFLLKYLPLGAKPSDDSGTLAAKLESRIEWMLQRGIDIALRDSERPSVADRSPLPGTVIRFSKV